MHTAVANLVLCRRSRPQSADLHRGVVKEQNPPGAGHGVRRDTKPVPSFRVYRVDEGQCQRNRQGGRTLVTMEDEKRNTFCVFFSDHVEPITAPGLFERAFEDSPRVRCVEEGLSPITGEGNEWRQNPHPAKEGGMGHPLI